MVNRHTLLTSVAVPQSSVLPTLARAENILLRTTQIAISRCTGIYSYLLAHQGVSPSLSICRECDFSWSSRFFTGDCVRSPFWQAARSAGAERAAKLSSLPAPRAQGGQRFGDYRGRIIPVRLGLHLEIRVNGWPEVRSHDSQCSSLFRRQHRHLRIDTLIVSGPLTAYR